MSESQSLAAYIKSKWIVTDVGQNSETKYEPRQVIDVIEIDTRSIIVVSEANNGFSLQRGSWAVSETYYETQADALVAAKQRQDEYDGEELENAA